MNNLVYLYNGTWKELKNLLLYLLKTKKKPFQIACEETFEPDLLTETIYLDWETLNKEDTNRINISKKLLKVSYYVYLSNDKQKELVIYYLLLNYLKYGDNILFLRKLNCVNKALNLANYVKREAHRLKGFLRFKEMSSGIFYATIDPENNIIFLLAKHFKERLATESWIIHDAKRNLYCLYNGKTLYYLNKNQNLKIEKEYTKTELEMEDLWRTFFETIAIKERENKRCQMNFMPKKYWKNIIEMESEYEKSN